MDKNEQIILEYISKNPLSSSKEIHEGSELDIGYATVKRILKRLYENNFIEIEGKGRGTKYLISLAHLIIKPIDIDEYFEKEIDEREIKQEFDLGLIPNVLGHVDLFSQQELDKLEDLQNTYTNKIKGLSDSQYQKEHERLAIDLSWKSSQIEGNTYSLLETERLLKEQETAEGKNKDEATMLLNHKEALDFITENPDYLDPVEIRSIEDIHSILIKDLGVDRNIRTRGIGITGTNYRPLDNEYQIRETLQHMCNLVNSNSNVFEKSLLLLVLLSYIQAFNDGNKRTARIVSNACLINNKYCPISFRTINSIEYKKAMLIFYEQNNIFNFKKIFIDQFEFAVKTYF
ncbi:MAG: cell filamentation protein Fic [Saprospiraceae bacterium]|nr:cell filamentation protein Fic [Saprospiraceae bacterium]